jgi:serine/threonine protein kinase
LAGTVQATTVGAGPHDGSSLRGAAPYLAPERLAGKPASAAADVYALGVIMRELATGRPVVAGSEPPRDEDLPGLEPLMEIVRACLEPRPELRLQNAGAVMVRLERLRDVPRAARRRAGALVGAGMLVAGFALPLVVGRASFRGRGAAERPAVAAPAREVTTIPLAAAPGATSVTAAPLIAQSPAVVRRRRVPSVATRGKGGVAAPASVATSGGPAPQTNDDPATRGEAMMVDGKFEEACAELERARAEHPRQAPIYRLLGKCYMRSGRPERAKENYRMYLELAPEAADRAFIKGILQ